MDFVAFDFETPNTKNAVPCSLGIVLVENNIITKSFSFLIDPEQPFSARNTKIHGIKAEDVKGCPKFSEIWSQVEPLFRHYPAVAHNVSFDKLVLEKAARIYHISLPEITYYCTMQLAKANYSMDCYSLDSLCDYFHISLANHHCCTDDSCAAAEIMIHMLSDQETHIFANSIGGQPFEYACSDVDAPMTDSPSSSTRSKHDDYLSSISIIPDYEESSVVYDEVDKLLFDQKSFVITGDIENYTRAELQEIIESRGGKITGVNRKLDYLVVGMQNKNLIKDTSSVKSTKIIKAEQLRDEGYPLKIISDEFFISQLEVQYV